MALVAPQQVTVYQVGDVVQGGSFNNFLDAIDGSYCGFEGGNSRDPNVDGQYPDPQPGGFTGPENCGGFASTKVISTSYGSNEADLSPKYVTRQCMEYMKLGLQGVSVLYSSGDFGVAGNGGACIDEVTGAYNNGYVPPPIYASFKQPRLHETSRHFFRAASTTARLISSCLVSRVFWRTIPNIC
jgi:tripeptidyl-peptidase-1